MPSFSSCLGVNSAVILRSRAASSDLSYFNSSSLPHVLEIMAAEHPNRKISRPPSRPLETLTKIAAQNLDGYHFSAYPLSRTVVPSEQGIRKLKIKLKNSGCFCSDMGADAFMDSHSIVETTKKHGDSPYNAILAFFKRRPHQRVR